MYVSIFPPSPVENSFEHCDDVVDSLIVRTMQLKLTPTLYLYQGSRGCWADDEFIISQVRSHD
jgi:hypothetical protein